MFDVVTTSASIDAEYEMDIMRLGSDGGPHCDLG